MRGETFSGTFTDNCGKAFLNAQISIPNATWESSESPLVMFLAFMEAEYEF